MDRAILDQNEPLDSEDQELVISQLSLENDASLKLYKKVLALSILVEIPPLVMLARAVTHAPLLKVLLVSLLVLLNFLTLVNTVFDVKVALQTLPHKVQGTVGRLVTFEGVSIINGILVVQMLYITFWEERLGWMGIFTVVPIGNLITLMLLRSWHEGVALELEGLHGLKYKFKNV